ncbi:AAA family ATPase [Bradyrhizobium sp. CCBAU 45394]|uniref:AAA family ATPase n=1 Tax=Bradyrhizobium sp. CCBAU 45394 TaxID=1325087 RepID=UPI002303CAAF|nr:AAA family ATPase [Bradyrhizobium sp. CCBAU 45394]
MGAVLNSFDGHVDFAAIKAASLGSIETLASRWLPHGKRLGNEWVATNPTRNDGRPGSFKVNVVTGVWSDFATGESGGDMMDLWGYLFGGDPLDAAKEVGDLLGVPRTSNIARLHLGPRASIVPAVTTSAAGVLPPGQSLRDPSNFPPRTPPNAHGKPRFVIAGAEGPQVYGDEKRRHVYKCGTVPIKIKVMRKAGDALIWYRVSDGDVLGWQLQKPAGFKEVVYFGSLDWSDADRLEDFLFWPEGEKDAESVTARGELAVTFGGVGDGLPKGCEEYIRGRHVVVLVDNDAPGRDHAAKKAALAYPIAASVRVVHFTEVPHKGDVSDYFQMGNTIGALLQISKMEETYKPRVSPEVSSLASAEALTKASVLKATPYTWIDPTAIPRRDFVYGRHLIRKFVSATIAPGGVGKSSLIVSEALSMVSGKALLGVQPTSRLRVWLWNLEDPQEEIARHVQATAQHFELSVGDIEGHLFVDSGRDQRLVITITDRAGSRILEPVVDALVAELLARQIDHLVVDPFVSSHDASENDNSAMDCIVKAWGRVAQRANCSIELVHHSRKSAAGETETTAESARGGKALTDGCRSVRVLNRMTTDEAEKAGVDAPRSYFRVFVDKANLAPPAETSDWFHLKSIDLGNSPSGGYGDSVGVVVPWAWPDLMSDVTVSHLRQVQAIVSKRPYRENHQAQDWVGKAVAEALGLDLDQPKNKRKIMGLLKVWLKSGALKKVEDNDVKGNPRYFVQVGVPAND